MARTLRPSVRATNKGAYTLADTKKMAKSIIAKAERQANTTIKEARKRETALDKKVEVINKLLPHGFTPAPNPELLPPSIRAKAQMTPQRLLMTVNTQDGFIPTPAMRQLVYDYSKFGVPTSDIALRIVNPLTGRPIDVVTLKRHFFEEIDIGHADGNVSIAETAYHMTVGQAAEYDEDGRLLRAERAPNPSVLIAQGKNRLKWFERRDLTVNLSTVGVDPATAAALSELSEDELRTLRTIAARRAAEKSGSGPEDD